jgi:hypothetical protein
MMPVRSACRLFVILARDADVGVILRRGPSKWVQIIKWDTRRDTFDDGAWFHGRIYEKYCDVSPDGELFVYFVAKHNRYRCDDGYGYVWSAVSRPPWLYALALWPGPCGTYPGGGRFTANRRLTLCTVRYDVVAHLNHPPPRGLVVDRQDWSDWTPHKSSKEVQGSEWSGRDQNGHIIYARDGKLFRSVNGKVRELIDFNDRTPNPQPAPGWAQHFFTKLRLKQGRGRQSGRKKSRNADHADGRE